MTRGEADKLGAGHPATCAPSSFPRLPLVSVIIVNYNYGRYLAASIESVFAQTYEFVECIVVDNGSTDGSGDVIDACALRYPSLKVLKRETNGGQTQGCVEGFARSLGPYIVFLDADDVLLPDCVATHVAVHVSSRVHVGFTSGDMLQMVDGQTVLSTNEAAARFIAAYKPTDRPLLRPSDVALGPLRPLAEDMADRVYLVPRLQKDWTWAPTSGNCFRRDALNLFLDGPGLSSLMSQTDLFLALAVNSINGSMLIDQPVFAYRLHGGNVFSNRPQLGFMLNFDSCRGARQAALARRLIIDQLCAQIGRFVQESWMHWGVFEALARLDSTVEDGAWRGGSYAARAVARNFSAVAAAAGEGAARTFVVKGAPPRLKMKAMLNPKALENDERLRLG